MDLPAARARAEAWIAAPEARDPRTLAAHEHDKVGPMAPPPPDCRRRPQASRRGKADLRAHPARGVSDRAPHVRSQDIRPRATSARTLRSREGAKRCAATTRPGTLGPLPAQDRPLHTMAPPAPARPVPAARALARTRIGAWTARDLLAVPAHAGDKTRPASPRAADPRACAGGPFAARPNRAPHSLNGMANPALRFTLEDLRLGVNALCILTTRDGGERCADTVQLDAQVHYRHMIARSAP